jgi:hypothetical protein
MLWRIIPMSTTKNPRVNVTFEKQIAGVLAHLAKQEHKSVSSVVRDLALEALELREDYYLSKLSEKIDKPGAKRFGHDEVWKKYGL